MKYQRWIATILFISSGVIQCFAIVSIQWISFLLNILGLTFTIRIALVDKDNARLTNTVFFMFLSVIALWNWLKHA
jgi:hypothetical protein